MKNKTQAVCLILLSSFFFCMMSLIVKISSTDVSTMQQVFFRNLVSLFIIGIFIYRKGISFFGEKKYQITLCARSFFGFLGVIMLFYATANARQADVALLNRTSPIWVTIFAILILKEKISKIQVPVVLLCLMGAFIAMRPSFDSDFLPLLLAVGSAFCTGLAYTMISFCKGKANPLTVVFHFSFFSTVCAFFFMLPTFVMPTWKGLAMLVLIGIFAAGGQITITYAYQKSPASEISIYDYTGIVISALLGYFVLSEKLTIPTIAGGVLIVGSALWSFLYNRRGASI